MSDLTPKDLDKLVDATERLGVVGSPSSTAQLALDILGAAVTRKLVGELALFRFAQDSAPHYALGQITEVQLRNVWHEDPTMRSLIRQRGRVDAVSERQDTHLGQMVISAVFRRGGSQGYEPSILGTVPWTPDEVGRGLPMIVECPPFPRVGGLSRKDAEMAADQIQDDEAPQHLKQVSRIKHIILQKYLPSWEVILGSKNRRLCYFDCYAGPGVYEFQGQKVDGSPIIAVRAAQEYLAKAKGHQMTVILVEKDEKHRASLETELKRVQPYGQGLQVHVMAEDVKEFVPKLLGQVPNLAPSFFMVDPYGHPLTVPILNDILKRRQTEALINFMFYRINMDAGNAKVQHHLDEMFGDDEWRTQAFLKESGWKRERGFLDYFASKIHAQHKLPFRIRFDVEDGISGSRTKYYLIHASNHPKAALLMKEVMWPLGDEEGLFDFSGEKHGMLFSSSPREEELRQALLREYSGKQVEFDQLREETWDLPFIEKHYRSVVKQLKEEGLVEITPVSSKTDRGLKKKDRVRFLPPTEGGST